MSGVALLRSFELRAWARAFMLRECMFDSFGAAFAPLWSDGARDGLLEQHGAQALMDIIKSACDSVGVRSDVDEPA